MKIPSFWERHDCYIDLYSHSTKGCTFPFHSVKWKGFTGGLEDMSKAGWKIRVYMNPYINKVIVKIVNPAVSMVGTIRMDRADYEKTKILDLDNLHAGGTRKMKKQPPLDRMRILTEADVPQLLATANMLLEKNRKRYIKKVKLPEKNVIYLENYLSKLKA